MIGTKAHANIAATLTPYALPEGWTYLNAGYSRMVFLSPEGVCYKVLIPGQAEGDENAMEAENYLMFARRVSDRSNGLVRLAPCHLHNNGVLAMEYVPEAEPAMYFRTDECIFPDWTAKAIGVRAHVALSDFMDVNVSNVWFDTTGVVTMIDYAA